MDAGRTDDAGAARPWEGLMGSDSELCGWCGHHLGAHFHDLRPLSECDAQLRRWRIALVARIAGERVGKLPWDVPSGSEIELVATAHALVAAAHLVRTAEPVIDDVWPVRDAD